jgi:hypothetical protein
VEFREEAGGCSAGAVSRPHCSGGTAGLSSSTCGANVRLQRGSAAPARVDQSRNDMIAHSCDYRGHFEAAVGHGGADHAREQLYALNARPVGTRYQCVPGNGLLWSVKSVTAGVDGEREMRASSYPGSGGRAPRATAPLCEKVAGSVFGPRIVAPWRPAVATCGAQQRRASAPLVVILRRRGGRRPPGPHPGACMRPGGLCPAGYWGRLARRRRAPLAGKVVGVGVSRHSGRPLNLCVRPVFRQLYNRAEVASRSGTSRACHTGRSSESRERLSLEPLDVVRIDSNLSPRANISPALNVAHEPADLSTD